MTLIPKRPVYQAIPFIVPIFVHRHSPSLPATIPPQGFYYAWNLSSHVRLASNRREQFRLNFIWRKTKPTEVQAGHEHFVVPSLLHQT
jgi:hypothetical protein